MHITHRQLVIGPHSLVSTADDLGEAPYVIAGPRMYVIGRASGRIGGIGDEHLVGEMGGVWAHPLKVAEGFAVDVCDSHGVSIPVRDALFEEHLSDVVWRWSLHDLTVERRDAVVDAPSPTCWSSITLRNQGTETHAGELHLRVVLKFVPAWMSGMRSGGGSYSVEDGWLLGRDRAAPEQWGVACGTTSAPDSYRLIERDGGCDATLVYRWSLAGGDQHSWHFALVAETQHGADAAQRSCQTVLANGSEAIEQQLKAYAAHHLAVQTPDADLNRDTDLAQANLRLLDANYPDLGAYFLAGLPEYPQLFGCDTAYSVPGALAAGYATTMHSALEQLASYAERACGRVPHELTTNGRIFHPGNIQETPQFVIACWDYLRWTGDMAFARKVYPLCCEGMDGLLLSACWPEGLYPVGDGMVERLGMGSRKLDSACYHYAALHALAALSSAMDEHADAERYAQRAARLKERFAVDWWLEDEGLYADSLHSDNTPQLDGHWTIALPLQLGLTDSERATRMFERIEREWVNQWGLVHTRERDERVWTLPTGLLALADFAHGRAKQGLKLLHAIGLTARTGTLGTFKELIPEGICFVQLWSAALYLQIIVEGLAGVQPLAHLHQLHLAPCMPEEWDGITLHGLHVGDHMLNMRISSSSLHIEHLAGTQPLLIRFRGEECALAAGETRMLGAIPPR